MDRAFATEFATLADKIAAGATRAALHAVTGQCFILQQSAVKKKGSTYCHNWKISL